MSFTAILALLGAYALALLAYRWLNATLDGADRWRMFRLLMLNSFELLGGVVCS